MGVSIPAQETAREVLELTRQGKRANISKIAMKHGYAETTALTAEPQKTKSYQDIIRPYIEELEEARKDATRRLRLTISKAKYRDLVDSIDKLTKNIQLLSGKSTENLAIGIKALSNQELDREIRELEALEHGSS